MNVACRYEAREAKGPTYFVESMRRMIIFMMVALGWLGSSALAPAEEVRPFSKDEIELLAGLGSGTGWRQAEIRRLLSHDKVKKIPGSISDNVTQPIQLSHERYKHYTYREAINRALAFQSKWRTQLSRASSRYNVDEEVIIGILLVETNFGIFKGNQQLLSVFSSLYVDAHRLLEGPSTQEESMRKRIETKQEWAKNEFRALLRMGKERGFDLLKLEGSYAGAFGLAQFLPSSYMSWARNAYGGKRANLFWEPDAIHSVAHYLKVHGYRKKADKAHNDKAIWAYNRSMVYVDTVRAVGAQLKSSQVATQQ